jgi:hypothetical protein
MTSESEFGPQNEGTPKRDFDRLGDQFRAAVDAAFGDAPDSVASPDQVSRVREVVDALREAPHAQPPAALRSRAVALYGERTPLLERWVATVRRIAMALASPPTPSLAGFRATEAPLQTFHAQHGDLDAWLDLQVDRDPSRVAERRLRGQVTLEWPANGLGAVAVHAVETGSGHVIASSNVDDEGRFTMRLEAALIDLVVELADGDDALAVPGIVLRS